MARLQRDYDAAFPGGLGRIHAVDRRQLRRQLRPGAQRADEAAGRRAEEGHPLGGGSDFPVAPFAARCACGRRWRARLNGTFGKTPFGTAEAVDVRTALRSYTVWAAHTIFVDDRVGSVEVGNDADLAVWDRDIYTVPTAALKDLRAQLTLVRGRIVHRGPAFAR